MQEVCGYARQARPCDLNPGSGKETIMSVTTVDEARLKEVVKTAVLEVFEERRDWLADLLGDALLDIGLGYAIQEGEQTPTVSREEVFRALEAGS